VPASGWQTAVTDSRPLTGVTVTVSSWISWETV